MRIDDWRSACQKIEHADREYAGTEEPLASEAQAIAIESETNLKEIAESLAQERADTQEDAQDVLEVARDIADKDALSSMRDCLLGRLIERALEWVRRT